MVRHFGAGPLNKKRIKMYGFDTSVPRFVYVETEQEAKRWLQYFLEKHKANDGLGIDTETTGLDTLRDRPIVWSLSDGVERVCIEAKFLDMFRPLLENPEVCFDLTNAKFDMHMLANVGIDLTKAGEIRDTVVQSWLLNENNEGRHGLKECTMDHFGRETPKFEQVFGEVPKKKVDKKTGQLVSKTVADLINEAFYGGDERKKLIAADYASLDAFNTTNLRVYLDSLLEQIDTGLGYNLRQYFHKVETAFTKVLFNCERRGFKVDKGYLMSQQAPMESEMEAITVDFNRLVGEPVNLGSTKQLQKVFFDILKKKPTKFTDGGVSGIKKPSLDNEVLEKWAGSGDEWSRKLLRFRLIQKTYGTYVKGLQQWLSNDYRIHCRLNQTGTVSGRLSSSSPNLQNLPRPSEDPFKIRDAFTHGQGELLIVADYEQLEMRLLANASNDEKMINAIRNNIDIHCLTVSEIYNIPYEDVINAKKAEKLVKSGKRIEPLTEIESDLLFKRQSCKAVGFGIVYGIGGRLLAANLTLDSGKLVTEDEGNALIEKWFKVFPGAHNYIVTKKAQVWRKGYVQTILGRFRRFGDLSLMSRPDRGRAERQAVNSEIQGSAADIAKAVMVTADNDPELKALGVKLILQIHDELIFTCPYEKATLKRAKDRVKEIMEHPFSFELAVPLPVECGHGLTWATAK